MKKPLSTKSLTAPGVLCAALLVICWLCRSLFIGAPFSVSYTLDGPSGVFPGMDGRMFVIDRGKKLILLTNEQGMLYRTINCGRDSEDAPYYVSLVTEGPDGSIYIAEVRYAGMGTRIRQERIFRYDRNGYRGKLLYAIDYTEIENMPLQYGNILSMREEDGFLVLSVRTPDGLAVRRVSTRNGIAESREYQLPGQYISDADVVPGTMLPTFTNRMGQLCTVEQDGHVSVLNDEGRTLWMLCAERNGVYYTDLASNAVLYYDFAAGEEQVVLQGEDIIYTVQARGNDICAHKKEVIEVASHLPGGGHGRIYVQFRPVREGRECTGEHTGLDAPGYVQFCAYAFLFGSRKRQILGSIILSFGSFSIVYYTGAAILHPRYQGQGIARTLGAGHEAGNYPV